MNLQETAQKIQDSQKQIENLQNQIRETQQLLRENLSQEMTPELEILKSAILQVVPKAKISPTPLGFTLSSPILKEHNKGDITRMLNSHIGENIAKAQNLDFYSPYVSWRAKTIAVYLTKAYIRKNRPNLKGVLDIVEC
jgi:hypothetical protein